MKKPVEATAVQLQDSSRLDCDDVLKLDDLCRPYGRIGSPEIGRRTMYSTTALSNQCVSNLNQMSVADDSHTPLEVFEWYRYFKIIRLVL